MRVTDGAGERPAASSAQARTSFAHALRRAGGVAVAVQDGERRSAGARAKAGRAEDAAARDRRETSRDEERGAPVSAPSLDARRSNEAAAASELRAAVRALPVAIQAAHVRDGEPLALSLGRCLDVEIRAGAAGIEVSLRPDPRLARAAEAELPALAAALRARGIVASRLDVRARGGARGRERPR